MIDARKIDRIKNRFCFERIRWFVILICFVMVFLLLANIFNVKWNGTSSMPIGFYRKIKDVKFQKGDIAAACLPSDIAKEGIKNGYIMHGACENGSIPVVKQIIAVPSDHVQLTPQAIIVNGVSYLAPSLILDHNCKVIKRFVEYRIFSPAGGYWLYGANSPILSWDSRFFGPVQSSNIIGVYKKFL